MVLYNINYFYIISQIMYCFSSGSKKLNLIFNVQFGQQTSVDVAMGNRHANPQSEPEDGGPGAESRHGRSRLRSEGAGQQEEGEEPELEVPPPMRPISSIPAAEEVKKVMCLQLITFIVEFVRGKGGAQLHFKLGRNKHAF
jgi:hypothetical protein